MVIIKLSVQTFQLLSSLLQKGKFCVSSLGMYNTSIYWPFSYPLRSLGFITCMAIRRSYPIVLPCLSWFYSKAFLQFNLSFRPSVCNATLGKQKRLLFKIDSWIFRDWISKFTYLNKVSSIKLPINGGARSTSRFSSFLFSTPFQEGLKC